jgi:hypothetical protein
MARSRWDSCDTACVPKTEDKRHQRRCARRQQHNTNRDGCFKADG